MHNPIMESISFDDMMNNPDILLRACNETFGTDGTQQQYYVQSTPVPASSVYLPQQQQQQPSQVQQIQTTTKVLDTLVKEIKELRTRIKKLEDTQQVQQQVQVSAIQLPPINIPVRLDITNAVAEPTSPPVTSQPVTSPAVTSPAVGQGAVRKKIEIQNKRKKTK